MNKLLAVMAVVLGTGCWSSSRPASEAPEPAPVVAYGGAAYGGAAYGGAAYGGQGHVAVRHPISLQQEGVTTSLTGTGDISSGFDDTNVYGGLIGNTADESNAGLGVRGTGPGGGGTGWGTIGTGRYGTIGHGSGTSSGYGVGGGAGGMRGRSATVPTVRIGQPTVIGRLDKGIVRRYIKRNIQKLSYCYEKELLSSPTIAGTLKVTFTIDPGTGRVTSSTAAGVDEYVESCVAGVVKGIEFPRPKGDQDVQVVFPFTFAPGS